MKWRGRGATKLPELERRRLATQATKEHFIGRPFDWKQGRHCVQLAHYHLRQMGKRPPSLPKIRSADDARRELKARGWTSVGDMLDSLLQRIPPAMMLPGDIAITPGDDGLDSVLVYVARDSLLGWLPDGSRAVIYEPDISKITGAWRV